ncbi:5-(carboxyamino)imidazole ribonucleotide mutase [bacterium]|nr:5-(carboxyamino)imidazole ribonucleotide mutase [bacterium]
MPALIGVVLGSHSDVKRMEKGLERLRSMRVSFEMCIASAHRTPERLAEWLRGAEARGVRVVIAGAGAAAHLPGVVASKTLLPVIGVPFNASPLGGTDALYSIVQMPPGIPVATVGIDSAENAAVLALHILAIGEPSIREKLRAYRAGWQGKIAEQNEQLYEAYPEARPGAKDVDLAQEMPPEPRPVKDAVRSGIQAVPSRPEGPVRPGGKMIWKVDPERPELEAIEEAVDILLDGGVIAVPTDTVYGLLADATNPRAVERLYELKGRDRDKPIAVLIDSEQLFHTLTVETPEKVEELIDLFWPGPLTLVTRKRGAALHAVSSGESLGLRVPDNLLALGLINMLSRPVAATSANLAGEKDLRTASEIAGRFGRKIDMILDTGPLTEIGSSTVLSLVEQPFRILREGPISRDELKAVLGDLLA